MKRLLVIHHTDLDGSGSAAVVKMRFRNEAEVFFRKFNYGYVIKPEELEGYDMIISVDVSFWQDGLDWIYQLPNFVAAIDHHIGAIRTEETKDWMASVPGLRVSEGKAAVELCWEYFFSGQPKPEIVKYLSAYDVWDKDRFDWTRTEQIQYGSKYYFGLNPDKIIEFIDGNGDIEILRSTGEIILNYLDRTGKGKLVGGGFYIHNFYGYRVMALNTTDFCSRTFLSLYDQKVYDVMMPFQIVPNPDKLGEFICRVSFYTENPDLDMSELAKKFGGSGHKGAAGCIITVDTLQQILSCSGPLKSVVKSKTDVITNSSTEVFILKRPGKTQEEVEKEVKDAKCWAKIQKFGKGLIYDLDDYFPDKETKNYAYWNMYFNKLFELKNNRLIGFLKKQSKIVIGKIESGEWNLPDQTIDMYKRFLSTGDMMFAKNSLIRYHRAEEIGEWIETHMDLFPSYEELLKEFDTFDVSELEGSWVDTFEDNTVDIKEWLGDIKDYEMYRLS